NYSPFRNATGPASQPDLAECRRRLLHCPGRVPPSAGWRRRMRRQAIVSAFAAVLLCISPAAAQQARSYALATGTTGGTYYPVGVAIEALVKALLGTSQGLQVRAIPTGGSSDNLR